MEFVKFEDLRDDDLIKQTGLYKWAIWKIKKSNNDWFLCEVVDYAGGKVFNFLLSKKIYNSIDSEFKYIGNIKDFPELLL